SPARAPTGPAPPAPTPTLTAAPRPCAARSPRRPSPGSERGPAPDRQPRTGQHDAGGGSAPGVRYSALTAPGGSGVVARRAAAVPGVPGVPVGRTPRVPRAPGGEAAEAAADAVAQVAGAARDVVDQLHQRVLGVLHLAGVAARRLPPGVPHRGVLVLLAARVVTVHDPLEVAGGLPRLQLGGPHGREGARAGQLVEGLHAGGAQVARGP